MNRNRVVIFAVTAILTAWLSPGVMAHHSFSMFDAQKDMAIEGTVTAFTWQNPHVWIDVAVMKDGKPENWGLETQSLGILYRQGWNANSLKAGDKIKAELHPMRDGTPGGQLMRVIFPDGSELLTSMARRPAPAAGQPGAPPAAAQPGAPTYP